MSELFSGMDLFALQAAQATNSSYRVPTEDLDTKHPGELNFEDMLLLLVTQMQNQTIDNQMDTNDMMNQLIQMTVMQAMTEVSTRVETQTEASIMSYAASLVGKEVTFGVPDSNGKIQEVVGTVTGTGTYDGEHVLFVGNTRYSLSSVMAVGRLPDQTAIGGGSETDDKTDETKPSEGTGGAADGSETNGGGTEAAAGENGTPGI